LNRGHISHQISTFWRTFSEQPVINRDHQRQTIFRDRTITRPFWGELVIGILMGNRSG
jgi:hypothetical protein